MTTIPDAADLSGMAKATAAGIALNRPGATNYSLVNLTGLLNVAISAGKRFPGRSPRTLLMILMGKSSSRMIRSRELIWLSAQWEKFPWQANGIIRCTKVQKPFSLFFRPGRPNMKTGCRESSRSTRPRRGACWEGGRPPRRQLSGNPGKMHKIPLPPGKCSQRSLRRGSRRPPGLVPFAAKGSQAENGQHSLLRRLGADPT